jgi:hypothetical protein
MTSMLLPARLLPMGKTTKVNHNPGIWRRSAAQLALEGPGLNLHPILKLGDRTSQFDLSLVLRYHYVEHGGAPALSFSVSSW